MGLFGGSKSSSSVDNSQTTYETNEQSNLQGGVAAVRGSDNTLTVNSLDGGAISGALSFANALGEQDTERFAMLTEGISSGASYANELAKKAIDTASAVAAQAQSSIGNAYATANQKAAPLNSNMVMFGLSLAGGLLLFWAWGKK